MKKLVKKYPILGSSANPEKLSESIRGMLILSIPFIIKLSGSDLSENQLIEFINTGMAFWGGCVALYGLGRKLYYRGLEIYNVIKK